MNSKDRAEVIEAIGLFTGPVVAEFRAYRAEVAAFSARVDAFRAEAQADRDRLEHKVDLLDAEVGRIAERIFGADDGDGSV